MTRRRRGAVSSDWVNRSFTGSSLRERPVGDRSFASPNGRTGPWAGPPRVMDSPRLLDRCHLGSADRAGWIVEAVAVVGGDPEVVADADGEITGTGRRRRAKIRQRDRDRRGRGDEVGRGAGVGIEDAVAVGVQPERDRLRAGAAGADRERG